MRLQSGKMRSFSCAGGSFLMAYAGNMAFGLSVIQKCERKLATVDPKNTFAELERILDKEYRRNVLSHPGCTTDSSLPYQLLIAMLPTGGDRTELYVTEQTTIRRVVSYECIGIGESLAHYLISQSHISSSPERDVVTLATLALASVKGHVPGCGGISHFGCLRNDGTFGEYASFFGMGQPATTSMEWLEENHREYENSARRLLFMLTNPAVDDQAFEKHLDNFVIKAKGMRYLWRSGCDKFFINDLSRLSEPQDLQPPTTDPSHPQPSRESREGTDES
jgi:hypothetical protein